MVRPFRHPVNAADQPRCGLVIEDRITVKAIRTLTAIIASSTIRNQLPNKLLSQIR
jgi:hypothetical protein